MDNQDDSENNAKNGDSAYASSGNSKRGSKSTHSESISSGSSGYGEKLSTSGSSGNIVPKPKNDKPKRSYMKNWKSPALQGCIPPEPIPNKGPANTEEKVNGKAASPASAPKNAASIINKPKWNKKYEIPDVQVRKTIVETHHLKNLEGFSCALSMHDGVILHTTENLFENLGFSKDMWIGRALIDFIHPQDKDIFASQVTSSLALSKTMPGGDTNNLCYQVINDDIVPKFTNEDLKNREATGEPIEFSESIIACRIRRLRNISWNYSLKNQPMFYVPFQLKFSFKDITAVSNKSIYLIVKATPIYPAYQTPKQILANSMPFSIRHTANGVLDFIDIESVPYLGYMPQEIQNQNALAMYHPEDLPLMKVIYDAIMKNGELAKSPSIRMKAQNGDYVTMETEWSSFVNPWSKKVKHIIGKHYVLKGPTNPDVFKEPPPPPEITVELTDQEALKTKTINTYKEEIIKIINEVPIKVAEATKEKIVKRVEEIANMMENLLEKPKVDNELSINIKAFDRETISLGGISPHHESDDTDSPLSYNQMNFNENLQRYFERQKAYYNHVSIPAMLVDNDSAGLLIDQQTLTKEKSVLSLNPENSADGAIVTSTSPTNMTPSGLSENLSERLTESLLMKHNSNMKRKLAEIQRDVPTDKINSNRRMQNRKEHLERCNASFQPTDAINANKSKNNLKSEQSNIQKRPSTYIEHPIPPKKRRDSRASVIREPARPSPTPTPMLTQSPTKTVGETLVSMNYSLPEAPQPTASAHFLPKNPKSQTSGPKSQTSQTHTHRNGPYPQMKSHYPQLNRPFPQINSPYPEINRPNSYRSQSPPMYRTSLGLVPDWPQMNPPPYKEAEGQLNESKEMSWYFPKLLHESYFMYSAPMSDILKKHVEIMSRVRNVNKFKESTQSATPMEQTAAPSNNPTEVNPVRQTPKIIIEFVETGPPKPDTQEGAQIPTSASYNEGSGDSSTYSSFYSNYLNSESASNSNNTKKSSLEVPNCEEAPVNTNKPEKAKKIQLDPPWLNEVNLTREHVYKYQVPVRSKAEIIKEHVEKMMLMKQVVGMITTNLFNESALLFNVAMLPAFWALWLPPLMVNNQLSQLYADLRLEGADTRLTLENGMTSSSSSGRESCKASKPKIAKHKRDYSKLSWIYQEDAPLPPPGDTEVSYHAHSGARSPKKGHSQLTSSAYDSELSDL